MGIFLIVAGILALLYGVAWIAFRLSPEGKAVRRMGQAVAAVGREANRARGGREGPRRDLARIADEFGQAQRRDARRRFPLEDLREAGAKNIRWSGLTDAGIATLDDVLSLSMAQLQMYPGIGATSAERIYLVARAVSEELDRQPVKMPDATLSSPMAEGFVRAAAVVIAADRWLEGIPEQLAEIERYLRGKASAVRRDCTVLRVLFQRTPKGSEGGIIARANAANSEASAVLRGDLVQKARDALAHVAAEQHMDRATLDERREEYRNEIARLVREVLVARFSDVDEAPQRGRFISRPAPTEPVSFRLAEPASLQFSTAGSSVTAVRSPATPPHRPTRAMRPARWIPPGEAITVHGHRIPGGMIYVGEVLPPAGRTGIEDPALINPEHDIDVANLDPVGERMTYWPWYSQIPAGCRATYLAWLAGGRRDPGVGVGYVFLFFYGLERRLLCDAQQDEGARADAAAIIAEVEELLRVYGGNSSFRQYATGFLDLQRASAVSVSPAEEPPPEVPREYEVPFRIKLGLGQLVSRGFPLSPSWALAWLTADPSTRLRTPATRCPAEFRQLFGLRYLARFPGGLRIARNRTPLVVRYQPASAGFSGPISVPVQDLPDVTALGAPLQKLRDVAEDCATALEPYSRWIGKHPEDAGSPAAAAALPPELAARATGVRIEALCSWAEGLLGQGTIAVGRTSSLIERWSGSSTHRLARTEAVALAQFLEKRGVGMEPDVRFGGDVPEPQDPVVLFRQDGAPAGTPSRNYASAATLLRLGAAISGADGVSDDRECAFLAEKVDSSLDLTPSERVRLRASLRWLLEAKVGVGGLKRRVAALGSDDRARLGSFAVSVAASDGRIDASEVKALLRVFALLGLNADDVYGQLHRLGSGVLPGEPAARPTAEAAPKRDVRHQEVASPRTVVLDPELVRAKLAESEVVFGVLKDIFTEEPPAQAAPPPAAVGLWGLDPAHSALVRELVGRPTWSRSEYEEAAARLRLLPDGALETINDAAFEACGDVLVEGDDTLQVRVELAMENAA